MAEQIITIKNDILKAEISTLGAELQSIVKNGTEYIWNGDPDVWNGRCPLLFPICSALKEGRYELDGKSYTLCNHGFARFCEFEIETLTDNSAVFLLKSNEESKKQFPFDYELRVCYTLEGTSVKIGYLVKNTSDTDMYFSIGSHEGYMCPEGIDEYSLDFEKPEKLVRTILNNGLVTNKKELLGENVSSFPLDSDYFSTRLLAFFDLESRAITLNHKDGNRKVKISFDGCDYVLIWTMANKGGNYVCIEPWCGLPDYEESSYDFTKKAGINKLGAGEVFKREHTISIEK